MNEKAKPLPRLADTAAGVLVPMEAAYPESYPEIWRTVAACLFIGLRARGHEPAGAAELALSQAEILRAELGGTQPYLPRGNQVEISARDREIHAKFNGKNLDLLARDYQMTERAIRSIVAAVSKEEFRKRQGDLFGGAA